MKVFYNEDAEAVEQVAQRAGGCPIPRNTQAQAKQVFEQPDRVEYVTHYDMKNWSLKVPSNPNYSMVP